MKTLLGVIVLVIGALAIIVGVLYLTESVHAIPSFFPGHSALVSSTGKAKKHGYAALGVGVVLVIVSIVVMASGRRVRRY